MQYRIFMLAALAAITQSCSNKQEENKTETQPVVVVTQDQPANDRLSYSTLEDEQAYNYDMDKPVDNRVKAEKARTTTTPQARTTRVNANRKVGRITNDNWAVHPSTGDPAVAKRDVVYVVANSATNNSRIKTAYEVPRNVYIKQRRAIASNLPVTPLLPPGNADVDHYDKSGADYRGEDAMTHDGVAKNIERNLNYLDFSNAKPRNDGGDFNK